MARGRWTIAGCSGIEFMEASVSLASKDARSSMTTAGGAIVVERMFDMLKSRGRVHLDGAPSNDVGPRRVSLAVSLFAAIAVLIGVDLLADAQTGVDRGHLAIEGLVMGLAVIGISALWRGFLTARGRAAQLDVDLALLAPRRRTSVPRREKHCRASAKPSTASSSAGS